MKAPIVTEHGGLQVVRDDLFPGGTKARFLPLLFEGADELVYASPCEGGAQTAIATVAAQLGKRATIFVAKRATPHPRGLMAKRLGAQIIQVEPGYLTVVKARAEAYVAQAGAGVRLLPFGLNVAQASVAIGAAATQLTAPEEIWCASGSGVLARALSAAFPLARMHCVQVGRAIAPDDVKGAAIHVAPYRFERPCKLVPPFPADPHYDAKAWEIARAKATPGALFWNVTGPAEP